MGKSLRHCVALSRVFFLEALCGFHSIEVFVRMPVAVAVEPAIKFHFFVYSVHSHDDKRMCSARPCVDDPQLYLSGVVYHLFHERTA